MFLAAIYLAAVYLVSFHSFFTCFQQGIWELEPECSLPNFHFPIYCLMAGFNLVPGTPVGQLFERPPIPPRIYDRGVLSRDWVGVTSCAFWGVISCGEGKENTHTQNPQRFPAQSHDWVVNAFWCLVVHFALHWAVPLGTFGGRKLYSMIFLGDLIAAIQ